MKWSWFFIDECCFSREKPSFFTIFFPPRQLHDAARNVAFIAAIAATIAGSWIFTGKWWKVHSGDQLTLLICCTVGDEILPSHIGIIIISHIVRIPWWTRTHHCKDTIYKYIYNHELAYLIWSNSSRPSFHESWSPQKGAEGISPSREIPIRIPNHQGKTPIYHCIESYRTHHELKISWNFRCWTLRNLRKKGKAVFKSEIIANFQAFVPCFPNHVPSIFQLIGWFIIHVFHGNSTDKSEMFQLPAHVVFRSKMTFEKLFFFGARIVWPHKNQRFAFRPGTQWRGVNEWLWFFENRVSFLDLQIFHQLTWDRSPADLIGTLRGPVSSSRC